MWPFLALQDQSAQAFAAFLRVIISHAKMLFSVEFSIQRVQAQSALRDFPDPAPFAMDNGEDLTHDLLRLFVALAMHRAHILVFSLGPAFFKLFDRHVNALQNVQRLEAGHNKRYLVFLCQRLVFRVTDHGANMPRREESLYAVPG